MFGALVQTRLRNAKVLFAFLVVMLIWAFHEMFGVRMEPRYLAFLVRVRVGMTVDGIGGFMVLTVVGDS